MAVASRLCFLCGLAFAGCAHVPRGGASEVHVGFGIPGVFKVQTDHAGIKATEKTIRAADSATEVQILLFVWKSSAKDLVLSNPGPDKP